MAHTHTHVGVHLGEVNFSADFEPKVCQFWVERGCKPGRPYGVMYV